MDSSQSKEPRLLSATSRLAKLEKSVHELTDVQMQVYTRVFRHISDHDIRLRKLELFVRSHIVDLGGGSTLSLDKLQEALNAKSPDS